MLLLLKVLEILNPSELYDLRYNIAHLKSYP